MNNTKVDSISEEHDKRIAENYVFDEVLGYPVLRTEYEKQAKFNHDDYKPTQDDINRFPSRHMNDKADADKNIDLTQTISYPSKNSTIQLRPPGYRRNGRTHYINFN